MKRIFLLLAIISILIGCSSAYKEHIAEAEAAIENADFENALTYYNAALEEDADSSEAKNMIALLNDYETILEKMADFEWTEAFDLANDTLKNDEIVPSLQKEVKELLTTIEEEKENEELIASELKTIDKLINKDQVEKANSKLSEIDEDIQSNALNAEVDELHNKLAKTEERIADKERKEKEAEKERLEEEEKQRAAEAKGLQKTYLQKADDLEDKIIRELQEAYPGIQDMDILFYSQYDSEWNDLLNEVWSVLEESLPKDDFEHL